MNAFQRLALQSKVSILILVFALLAIACGGGTPAATEAPDAAAPAAPAATDTAAAPPTATAVPPTETPLPPTDTPEPTNTPEPTATHTPEPTATPSAITVAQFKKLLGDSGYVGQSFKGIGQYTVLRPGEIGNSYSFDNWLEPIIVYDDGYVRMMVLNDLDARETQMEKKLAMLDSLFPEDFMAALREAQTAFLASVGRAVSGPSANVWPPPAQDFWKSTEGQYNLSESTIGAHNVAFSLWFWQIECPEGYICWFPAFGDTIFVGQSSFTFYTIEIYLAP